MHEAINSLDILESERLDLINAVEDLKFAYVAAYESEQPHLLHRVEGEMRDLILQASKRGHSGRETAETYQAPDSL